MKKAFYFITTIASLLFCSGVTLAQGTLWGTTRKGGMTGGGTILKTNADASDYYEVKKEWTLNTPGVSPQATLLQAANGKIYGLTPSGGAYGDGVLFEYSSGSSFIPRWHFKESDDGGSPQGGLVEASNGKIYGLTFKGGANYVGTLFEYDPGTQISQTKIHLSAAKGSYPEASMVAASNGKLYGTCSSGGSIGWGVLFEYDPATEAYTVKYNFDNTTGSSPQGALIQGSNGKLYGTTSKGGANDAGVLFAYDLSSNIFTNLHDFATATGALPTGALVQASNGKLYGMCPGGGANNFGVIFEYDVASSQYNLKQSFGQSDPMGMRPYGGLTEFSNGKLYGLTAYSVSNGVEVSVIIEFDPANGTTGYKLGAMFSKGAGAYNYSSMIRSGNSLYGVSPLGGETGAGTMFSYSPSIDSYNKILDFEYGEEGAFPYAGMTLAGNGKMYGLVSTGGSGKKGLLYEFDPTTSAYSKKIEFNGSNGANPLGEMLLASNGKLYGTTTFGGASSNTSYFYIENGSFLLREGTGYGVVFEYDPATGTYTKKAEFDASIGKNPYGQLMEASDGELYGVTNSGGANNGGTIYKFDIATSVLTKLKDLPTNAGFLVPGPRSGLTEAPNGKFYGVTPYSDNSTRGGIVYEYNPSTGDLNILKNFAEVYSAAPNDGNIPTGKLALGADGKLYGTTSQGGENSFFGGSIFQVDPATGQVTVKKILSEAIGIYPKGSFTPDASGKMYAFCNRGAWGNGGTLIQYDPATNSLAKKVEFRPPSGDEPDFSSLVLYPGKMDQRISLDEFTSKAYGSGTITLSANSSAGLPITYTSSNPSVATIAGNVITLVSIGSTDIKGVQAGTTDYNAAPDVTQTLTVTKADQTITFSPLTNRKVSENFFNLYAFVPSGLTPTFTSSDPGIASISGGYTLTLHKVGSVTITASQSGNNLYNAATSVDQSLTITIGDQTISFTAFGTVGVNATPFTINASATSGLPLTFTSSNTGVATVNGNTITVIATGTTNIKAVQAGDANFTAAPEVTRVLTITKIDQTITFFPVSTGTLGGAPFLLNGSASSLLPLKYSTASDKVTISTSQVTMIKAGSVTIFADQEGTESYNAAPRVEQSFCVNPAKPTISQSGLGTENVLLTSSATSGNQWFLNDIAITLATEMTFHPTAAGVYTVKSTVESCGSEMSDPVSLIVTGNLKNVESQIKMYPNPVTDRLVIELPAGNGSYMVQLLQASGSVVQALETTEEMVEWDVHELQRGLYIVRVIHPEKTAHFKLIKR